MNFATVLAVLTNEQPIEIAGVETHTLEWFLGWATVGLAVVTLMCALVTGLLSWISYKTYKLETVKRQRENDNVTQLANNSVDSMEHVATVAITHADRIRQMKRLRRGIDV